MHISHSLSPHHSSSFASSIYSLLLPCPFTCTHHHPPISHPRHQSPLARLDAHATSCPHLQPRALFATFVTVLKRHSTMMKCQHATLFASGDHNPVVIPMAMTLDVTYLHGFVTGVFSVLQHAPLVSVEHLLPLHRYHALLAKAPVNHHRHIFIADIPSLPLWLGQWRSTSTEEEVEELL